MSEMNLEKVLAASPGAMALWKSLTPIARRDFASWIASAKQAETRRCRIERVPDMLAKGKRRPCCYALVPMSLYKALAENNNAKKQWGGLTPSERRDFVGWIAAAEESEERMRRVVKACDLLARGKKSP